MPTNLALSRFTASVKFLSHPTVEIKEKLLAPSQLPPLGSGATKELPTAVGQQNSSSPNGQPYLPQNRRHDPPAVTAIAAAVTPSAPSASGLVQRSRSDGEVVPSLATDSAALLTTSSSSSGNASSVIGEVLVINSSNGMQRNGSGLGHALPASSLAG